MPSMWFIVPIWTDHLWPLFSFSGHCIFCRFEVKTKRTETSWWKANGSHSVDLSMSHTFLPFLKHIISWFSSNWFADFSCQLPRQESKSSTLPPAESIVSLLSFQHNGLFPSPRPLQLLAFSSFSSSGFLWQEPAAADKTAQARGQLRKCGGDSWTC